jgi:hypothetical protein
MGPDLGSVYNVLYNDVSWLHIKWGQYRQLFAQSQRRVDVINQAAGHFFRILQDALFEDIILHLARLTDPAQSGHKHKAQDNLSLRRLQLLVPDTLSVEVADLAQEALAACSAPRAWRNKRLAHRDLTVALATADDPLPGISRADVEKALAAFRKLLHRLEQHYWGSEVGYEHSLGGVGEADQLVYYLHKGLKAEQARHDRLISGKGLPEDIALSEDI